MNSVDWSALLHKFKISDDTPKPVSPSDIKNFEKTNGFILPSSYCGFCKTFGPGILTKPVNFKIATPNPASVYPQYDLVALNSMIREYCSEYREYCSDPMQFERAWFFCSDIATSYYFWDPNHATLSEQSEYGIYVLYRDWSVKELAVTFESFIVDVCLGSGIPAYDNSEPIDWVFCPSPTS